MDSGPISLKYTIVSLKKKKNLNQLMKSTSHTLFLDYAFY